MVWNQTIVLDFHSCWVKKLSSPPYGPTLIRHSYSDAPSPPGREHAGSGGKERRPYQQVGSTVPRRLPCQTELTCKLTNLVVTTTTAQKV